MKFQAIKQTKHNFLQADQKRDFLLSDEWSLFTSRNIFAGLTSFVRICVSFDDI